MDRQMLSKWLRTRPPFQKAPHPHDVAAADLIDEQAARIAELEAEGKVWREAHEVQKKHHWQAVERMAALEGMLKKSDAGWEAEAGKRLEAIARAERAEAERDEWKLRTGNAEPWRRVDELREKILVARNRIKTVEAERDEAIRALSKEGRLRGEAEARADAAWCAGRDAAAGLVRKWYSEGWPGGIDAAIRALTPPEDKP